MRLQTLVPTPKCCPYCYQLTAKTVVQTVFSENDYFHKGGSFVFAVSRWQYFTSTGSLSRRLMLQMCPKERPAPRKDGIAEDTWALLRQHAAARRVFFAEGRYRRRTWLQFVFWHWRAATPAGAATRDRLLAAADLAVETEADAAMRQA